MALYYLSNVIYSSGLTVSLPLLFASCSGFAENKEIVSKLAKSSSDKRIVVLERRAVSFLTSLWLLGWNTVGEVSWPPVPFRNEMSVWSNTFYRVLEGMLLSPREFDTLQVHLVVLWGCFSGESKFFIQSSITRVDSLKCKNFFPGLSVIFGAVPWFLERKGVEVLLSALLYTWGCSSSCQL